MSNVYQTGLAVVIAVLATVAGVVYLKKRAVAGMSEREKADRAAVRRGFRRFSGATRVYRSVGDVDADELEELARGERAGDSGVLSALAGVGRAVGGAVLAPLLGGAAKSPLAGVRYASQRFKSGVRRVFKRSGRERIPPLARRIGVEGVLLLAAGVVGTSASAAVAWRWLPGFGAGDAGALIDAAVEFAVMLTSAGVDLLGMYPLWEFLTALGVTGVTVSLSVVYSAWAWWGMLLLIGAVVLTVLDRVAPDRPAPADALPGVTLRAALMRIAGVGAASFVAGVAPVLAGRAAGYSGVGGVVGVVASVLVLVAGVVYAAYRAAARVHRVSRVVSTSAAAEYVARRVWTVIAVLGVPVLLALSYRAVDTGRVFDAARLLIESNAVRVGVAAALTALVLLVLAGVAGALRRSVAAALSGVGEVRAALGALRDGVSVSMSKAVIRTWMRAKGLPYLGVAAASAVLIGVFNAPVKFGIAGGVLVGALARGVYILFKRIEYANRLSDRGARDLPRAVVEVGKFEDSEGRPLYAARIHGRKLLHRDSERLAGDAAQVARDLLSDRGVRPTESEWAAERAYMDGHTQVEKWRKSLLAATRSDVKDVVSPAADPDDATEILLDERPRRYVAPVLESLEKKGVLERRPDKWELLR